MLMMIVFSCHIYQDQVIYTLGFTTYKVFKNCTYVVSTMTPGVRFAHISMQD